MTLVDNVRDDNYYLGVNDAPTYIAGFFSSQINELLDRNVMTIDAFDWLHRTGANPTDEPTIGPVHQSRPGRPYLYEGTFAHEYQHLLEYYQDPDEVSWVNEGLSDFAQTLTGYVDATQDRVPEGRATATSSASRASAPCRRRTTRTRVDCGGPENSLTLWGDQDSPARARSWPTTATRARSCCSSTDRYGLGFMSALHRDGEGQGLAGVQAHARRATPRAPTSSTCCTTSRRRHCSTSTWTGPRGVVTGIAKSRVDIGAASTPRSTWTTRAPTRRTGRRRTGPTTSWCATATELSLKGSQPEVAVVPGRRHACARGAQVESCGRRRPVRRRRRAVVGQRRPTSTRAPWRRSTVPTSNPTLTFDE